MKRTATISHWSPAKLMGFLLSSDTGNVERFFFHFSRIIFCEGSLDDVKVGYFARFIESNFPPKPGQSPFACEVEIYKTNPALAGLDVLAGKPEVSL